MTSQAQYRQQMRRARRQLTPTQREQHAHALASRVAEHPLFQRSRRIAGYFAVSGELDPWPLLERAWQAKKTVFLPVLVPYRRNRLWFAPYQPDDPMIPNRFGIPEPAIPIRKLINPMALDLVLVPLVAFDTACHRVGMGGGFYDRTFHFLRHRRLWKRPHLLGTAYELQRVEHLAPNPWDVPLTAVATEQGVYYPSRPKP